MAPRATDMPSPSADGGEELLGLWSDLETGVAMVLREPLAVQNFSQKVQQYDHWLKGLMADHLDAALYFLYQLAATSNVGYSAGHALVCATLCRIVATELDLPEAERATLVAAALTMNIGMTELQDQLALQEERPSPAQQQTIDQHPAASVAMLERLRVTDTLWLDVVGQHHAVSRSRRTNAEMPAAARLAQVLGTVDRYAAMISPRSTRRGRSPMDSARAMLGVQAEFSDDAGEALIRAVGLFPPGTLVELDNREVAVAVRRGPLGDQPVVAIVFDRQRQLLREPRLHQLGAGRPRIAAAVVAAQIGSPLDYRQWLAVGVAAWRQLEAGATWSRWPDSLADPAGGD